MFGHYQRRNELYFFKVDKDSNQIVLKKVTIDLLSEITFEDYNSFEIPAPPNDNESLNLIGVTIIPNLEDDVRFNESESLDFYFALVYTDSNQNPCLISYDVRHV